MSLNISIIAKREMDIYESNVTYNLSKMYYKAIDEEKGLEKLNGMSCEEVLPILNKAIADMVTNKSEYEKLNPENGWGSYEGLLKTFREMRDVCEDNPDGILDVR